MGDKRDRRAVGLELVIRKIACLSRATLSVDLGCVYGGICSVGVVAPMGTVKAERGVGRGGRRRVWALEVGSTTAKCVVFYFGNGLVSLEWPVVMEGR